LRVLLSHHLGESGEESLNEAVSAHLVYALHNEVQAVIEGRADDF